MRLGKLFKNKFFYLGLLILILGISLTTIISNYIVKNFNPPILKDVILDNLSFFRIAWIYDLLSIMSTLFLIIYVLIKRSNEMPYFLFMFGILYFVRAIFIVLTPLGSPITGNNPVFTSSTFTAGLYFSGHTAETFLAFLLAKGRYRIIFAILLISIIFSLLLARDIIA